MVAKTAQSSAALYQSDEMAWLDAMAELIRASKAYVAKILKGKADDLAAVSRSVPTAISWPRRPSIR